MTPLQDINSDYKKALKLWERLVPTATSLVLNADLNKQQRFYYGKELKDRAAALHQKVYKLIKDSKRGMRELYTAQNRIIGLFVKQAEEEVGGDFDALTGCDPASSDQAETS